MMNFRTIIIVSGISAIFMFTGCEQALSPVGSDIRAEEENVERYSAGVKLKNPYTVEAMLRARDSLEARGVLAKRTLLSEDFKPTHYYIKFTPETKDEYNSLQKNPDLVLWNLPLDYLFPEGIVNFKDSEVAEGEPACLYTAVKVNQKLPTNNYTIIDKLILEPEEKDNVLAKRNNFSTYYSILEQEALKITGNLPALNSGLKKTLGTWHPSGRIEVWDDDLNKNVPVASVNVRTRNWFKWWDGYTDANGKFYCPKGYYGDLSYSLRWQYKNNKFDIRGTGQAFYNGPSNKRGAWNLTISSGLSKMHAHVFRAGTFYLEQTKFDLNDNPFDLISILARDEKAPPDEGAHYTPFNQNVKIYRYSDDGTQLSPIELFRNTLHELGHAHHHEIYDGTLITYQIKIDAKIHDGWATAIAYNLLSCVYDIKPTGTHYSYQDWKIGGSRWNPLMIDLIDTYNQKLRYPNGLQDGISGYTLEQIESIVANGGCKKISDFANLVKALPLPQGVTRTMLDNYFNQFDGIPSPAYSATTLQGGYNFVKGQPIYSPNRRFFLIWQNDGNLVLYDTYENPWRDVWTSKTWGRETTQCIMQTDGNLVIYNRNNPANNSNVWSANTWGNKNAKLSITDDGRLIIYNASVNEELWSSTSNSGTLF